MRAPVVRLIVIFLLSFVVQAAAPLAQDSDTAVCPEPTCEDRCRAHAQELYRACVAAGGDMDACAARARAALAACVEENCRPDPTCEERCKAHADQFLRACVEAGNDPEACAERARVVLNVCLQENCVPDPTCDEKCRARAEEIYRACVAGGGDAVLCGERARAALAACVRENCDLCVCPDVYDPVCGTDGRTYPNACEARCAGVPIASPGECPSVCRCNDDCPDGAVCRDGACGRPCDIACFVADPVCGSDGRTYQCGAAEAACHGVTVLHRGECRPVCERDAGCPVGSVCAPTRDCPDPCGCADFCQACACPRVFDPVCGADGKTYANPCLARCAHVAVAHRGVCLTRIEAR